MREAPRAPTAGGVVGEESPDEARDFLVDFDMAVSAAAYAPVARGHWPRRRALCVAVRVRRLDLLGRHAALHGVCGGHRRIGELPRGRAVELTVNENHLDGWMVLQQGVELQGGLCVAERTTLVV